MQYLIFAIAIYFVYKGFYKKYRKLEKENIILKDRLQRCRQAYRSPALSITPMLKK